MSENKRNLPVEGTHHVNGFPVSKKKSKGPRLDTWGTPNPGVSYLLGTIAYVKEKKDYGLIERQTSYDFKAFINYCTEIWSDGKSFTAVPRWGQHKAVIEIRHRCWMWWGIWAFPRMYVVVWRSLHVISRPDAKSSQQQVDTLIHSSVNEYKCEGLEVLVCAVDHFRWCFFFFLVYLFTRGQCRPRAHDKSLNQ